MVLFRIAFRNLLLNKVKTLIVGAIFLFGTALVVTGNAMLDSIDQSMARSVVNSVSGHIQLQDAQAPDTIELFGGFGGSSQDIGSIKDFGRVRAELEALDEVKTVVPMGLSYAIVGTGNIIDRKLALLREAVREEKGARAGVLLAHVRAITEVLDKELGNLGTIADMSRVEAESKDKFEALKKLKQPAFWDGFKTAPLQTLEFLENKIAPLALGSELLMVAYIGTDTARFEETFDRFEVVQGERIPPGKRGILFNERFYNERVKHKTANRLDKIKERLDQGDHISGCDDCRQWIKRNIKQAASMVFEFDSDGGRRVGDGLRAHLGSDKSDLVELVKTFMAMDDDNFATRYTLFYDLVGPHITMYQVRIGDTFVMTGFGKGGYARKVPVKVYGTFRFRSLDKSPLAGGFNVIDMMTFRDLYGFMTEERRQEIAEIRKSVGVTDVEAEDAESALFGEEADLVEEATMTAFNETEGIDMKDVGARYTDAVFEQVHGTEVIEDGAVLNAAVMLAPGVDIEQAMVRIEAVSKDKGLGVRAIHWRKAAGLVGDFITIVRLVLYIAVFIIFVVALIIINNSLVMATLERTREIGTMRAIGAQRGFVMRMFLVETATLALLFGGLGIALGGGLVGFLSYVGLPAWSDVTRFLFAGPRLYPHLEPIHVLSAALVILVVGLCSTLYPARLATRITPLAAMRKED